MRLCEWPHNHPRKGVFGWIQDTLSCFAEVIGLHGYIPGTGFSHPKIDERGRWKAAYRTSVTFDFLRLIRGSALLSVTESCLLLYLH